MISFSSLESVFSLRGLATNAGFSLKCAPDKLLDVSSLMD